MAVPYSAEADVLAARNPGAWSLHSAGLLHQTLGRIFRNAGDLGRSLAESDKALDDFRRLDAFSGPELHIAMARPEADRDEVLHMLGLTQISRSAALLDAGRLAESLAAIEDGRRREEECLALAPGSPPPMRSLTIVPGLRSVVLLEMGRRQEAIAEARRELRLTQEFLATDDSAVMTQRDVSQAKRHLGNALGDPGPLAQAAKEIGAIADGDPEFLLNRVLQAGTLNEYGFALAGKGRPADAAAAFRQALSRSEQVLAQAPGWVDALREKGMAEAGLGSGQCRGTWARVKEKSPLRSRPGDSRGACVGLSVMVPEGGGTNVFRGGRCSGTSERLALWPDRDAAGVPERACLRFRC
jgi:tetratricopeptide (TPR) repeat protein